MDLSDSNMLLEGWEVINTCEVLLWGDTKLYLEAFNIRGLSTAP